MSATFDIIKESEAPPYKSAGRSSIYPPLLRQLGPGDVGRFQPHGKLAVNVRKAMTIAAKKAGIPITTWIVDGVVYCKLKETV